MLGLCLGRWVFESKQQEDKLGKENGFDACGDFYQIFRVLFQIFFLKGD